MYPLMSSARWGDKVVKKRHAKPLKVPFDQVRQENKNYKYNNGKPRAWIDSKSASDQEKFEERTAYGNTGRRRQACTSPSLLNGRQSLSTSGQCFQPLPPQYDAYLSPNSGRGESSPLVWHETEKTQIVGTTDRLTCEHRRAEFGREGCCLSTGNVQSNLQSQYFHLEKSRFANRCRSRVASCLVVVCRYADTFFRSSSSLRRPLA